MTYQFPPMDLFEKALDTLDESDIAKLRNDYLQNVFENELVKAIDEYEYGYETPIFDISPKKFATDSFTTNSIEGNKINKSEKYPLTVIKSDNLKKATKYSQDYLKHNSTRDLNIKTNSINIIDSIDDSKVA